MNFNLAKLLGAAVAASLFSALAFAQAPGSDYPSRPVKILVGYVPGPGPDLAARIVGAKLTEIMGQPFVIENKAGAAGTLATAAAALAPPDGYTLLMAESAQIVIAPFVYKSLPYNTLKDLTPIGLVTDGAGVVIVANPKTTKIRTLQELISEAKKNPGKLNYGSAGIGSTHHLIMESFKEQAGVDIAHVPYKGGGQSLPAFLAGDVEILVASLQSVWPHVKAGNAVILAVPAARMPVIPDVPSIGETLKGFSLESHTGLMGPANMPPEIVAKLSRALQTALQDPAVRTKLSAEGTRTVKWLSPNDYSDLIKSNLKTFGSAAKAANIKPE